jgi:hypothetical protein
MNHALKFKINLPKIIVIIIVTGYREVIVTGYIHTSYIFRTLQFSLSNYNTCFVSNILTFVIMHLADNVPSLIIVIAGMYYVPTFIVSGRAFTLNLVIQIKGYFLQQMKCVLMRFFVYSLL